MSKHLLEREFIEQLRRRKQKGAAGTVRAIGDDCAVLRKHGNGLELLTMDTLVENVHFDRSWHPPQLLGRKAASVNFSDIAAMGGIPKEALLSVAVPAHMDNAWLEQFIGGFLEAAAEFEVELVGGDTVKSNCDIFFTVTVIGEVEEDQVLYRNGAKVGDLIWVSGVPGQAAAGLELCRAGMKDDAQFQDLVGAHLDPRPEVALGSLLAKSGMVNAMMDTSDGIATDLAHLCKESWVGAEIFADRLPGSKSLEAAAEILDAGILDWALKGGEDFHLLFTSAPDCNIDLEKLVSEQTGKKIYCIGRIIDDKGVFLVQNNERQDIAYQGYDHFSE